jgi:hypothetical protein
MTKAEIEMLEHELRATMNPNALLDDFVKAFVDYTIAVVEYISEREPEGR